MGRYHLHAVTHLPECVCSLECSRGRDLVAGVFCLVKKKIIKINTYCVSCKNFRIHSLYETVKMRIHVTVTHLVLVGMSSAT